MSFFRYPGGKSKISNLIISKLESLSDKKDLQYREPFFGGGSIGIKYIQKNKIKDVWINDKDQGIFALWNAVIDNPEGLKQLVRGFKPTVEAFYQMKEELTNPQSIYEISSFEYGFKKLAIHQISYSGLGTKSGGPLGGANQKSEYKIDCRWSPEYICKKIDKLHSLFDGIIVKFSNADFQVLLEDNVDSLIYLDPPYFVKGNDLYQHGFTEKDHIRLAFTLRETNHKWLLSYDDCEEIRDLYSWANIEEVDVNYSITALKDKETGINSARNKKELLITKG